MLRLLESNRNICIKMCYLTQVRNRTRQIRGDAEFAANQVSSVVPFKNKTFKDALKILIWWEMSAILHTIP